MHWSNTQSELKVSVVHQDEERVTSGSSTHAYADLISGALCQTLTLSGAKFDKGFMSTKENCLNTENHISEKQTGSYMILLL
jgi:hypothetical protein